MATLPSRPAIRATGLRKSFGDQVVLDGIDLQVAEGTVDPAQVGPVRTSLRPIEISQPEGPSFTVDGSRWVTEVAPGLGAPYHQHMFSARLDMTVDGPDNAVDEVELERVPVGPGNQHGNAFTRRVTRLARESDGARTANASAGRAWHVVNPARTNRLGQPVAYALDPREARACPPTWPPTTRSTARTSSCGTPSG